VWTATEPSADDLTHPGMDGMLLLAPFVGRMRRIQLGGYREEVDRARRVARICFLCRFFGARRLMHAAGW